MGRDWRKADSFPQAQYVLMASALGFTTTNTAMVCFDFESLPISLLAEPEELNAFYFYIRSNIY
jgi:hypothetical protein